MLRVQSSNVSRSRALSGVEVQMLRVQGSNATRSRFKAERSKFKCYAFKGTERSRSANSTRSKFKCCDLKVKMLRVQGLKWKLVEL